MKSQMKKFLPMAPVIVAALSAASVATAQETIQMDAFARNVTAEVVPVANVESHLIGLATFAGVGITDDDEFVRIWWSAYFDYTNGGGPGRSYASFTFGDGSVVWADTTFEATPVGDLTPIAGGGPIIGGTGRFDGATGTMEFDGSRIAPFAEGGDSYYRITLALD